MTGHKKTEEEIRIMTEGGKRLGTILKKLLAEVKIGVAPLQIDALAQKLIQEAEGSPSFTTVRDYKWATCINVNDVVVHGIPTNVPFVESDVVGVDVGLFYKEYHTDTAWTVFVRKQKTEDGGPIAEDRKQREKFLKIGEEALWKAINQARVGKRIGDISEAIQKTVEGAGYSVVKNLVGHGVGKKLHESPQIPGIVTRPIEKTLPFEKGMVIAIEVIYNEGQPEIVYKNTDGWTLVTSDGSLSGVFEHTLVITEKEPIVLTQ